MNLKEIDKPEVKKTIVVYSGRFQPFHRGHNVAYQKLVSKFGANNVYIGTSDKTDGGKSPFNFSEKKTIMQKMFGIPSNKIVQLSNPYSPKEILSKFDGKTTAYIAAVGEKDATRLAGKYFKPYNGKTGYGYDEIGYTYIIPAEKNPISGTDVRNGLGNTDVEKSKSFFLKAYPKFDKDIFNMIKSKLNEEGLPGGIGVGLTLPNGYINGAPTGSTDELYDPINELLGRVAAEEIFNEWLENYLGEAPNPIMDKEITYNSADGKKKKITVRGALRLPKDHEAHIQAKKMVGPDDAPANEPKKKEVPNQPGQPVKKGDTAQGKADAKPKGDAAGAEKQAPPPEQKLSGAELKSSAEMTDADKHKQRVKETVDNARKGLAKEDNESIDKVNSPQSEERKGAMNVLKKAASYIGHGIIHTYQHNKEMLVGSASAVKSLASTGRFGAVKNKEGKTVHWDDFTEPHPGTNKRNAFGVREPKMKEVPVYKTDSHGHALKDKDGNKVQAKNWLGKPKTTKEPVFREDLTPEQKELAQKSWKESQKQKKGLGNLAKTTAIIMGSIAVTGGLMGGISAASKGAGFSGIMQGAGAKIAAKFGGGHLGTYVMKDIIKHSAFEALGANQAQASLGGIALGVAGIFENKNGEEELDTKKFVPNFVEKTLEIMQNYKLSDEQLLQTIAQYKREGATNQSMSNAADLMKENISESKKKSIENFLEFATKRLKLQETPKVTLVSGREYGNVKSSLGGYNPEDKAIYVAIEGRLTADILRTIAHEMVHRKQDELGLIRNEVKDGADGSPIENQAHAVAGILMREYGRLNRQIYNEVSNVATANTADVPDGSFIKKGKKRKLNSDKTEVWYSNGGYTQTDFPKADTIFGDDDAEERTVKYTIKNLPNIEYVETEFFKEDIDVDVDTGDEVLMGKFKNKKVTVKDIGKDQHGMPTINGKQATTFRTVSEKLSQSNLNSVEKYADRELSPADIEFSNHFFDRVNDTRNGKEISEPELTGFFKRLSRHKKQFLDFLDKYNQIVVTDSRSDINIPFVKMANKVIAKTIMRKGDFKTSSPTIVNEAQAVSGGKVHKFITGKNLGFKGKKYSEIEFETLGIDNRNQTVRLKIIAPKEIGGNEMSLDFRTIRRGPFFKTDTRSHSINEGLILEGGAYGHMNHPFDISMNLTFGDLKKIINNALDGKLGVVREKTDGQALAISWKNGRLIAARNKGHLANGGASALDINALASKFGGRGALSDAYNFAMRDLSAAISGLGEKERQSIFKDGSAFCNLEVIYPENANVIPYGQSLLIFHNVVEYDEKGNAVGVVKGAESKLASLIKQTNAHVQSKYTLQGPPITKLPKDEKLSSQKSKFNSMLSRLQSEFGLSDKDGVADYHYAWWMNFVNKSKKNLAELEKEGLARRWAFDNKSFGIKSITDEDARKWADGVDKDAKDKIMKGNLRKFEDIFLGVGAEVLSFMSSVLTAQPDKALQSIKVSLESSISDIRNGGSEAQIRRLEKELARLNAIGGFEKLVPNEGLVFFYKGNTYKLTGTFAPLNQILGIFKFGR
jgi:hypothetical protein